MRLSKQRSQFETNLVITAKKKKIKCECCNFFARDFDDIKSIQKDGLCTECRVNFEYILMEGGNLPSEKIARRKIFWRT